MPIYNAAHWGIYEVTPQAGAQPKLAPFSADPAPTRIGLDQADPAVLRHRVERPAVRRGWLEARHTSDGTQRGRDAFVEVDWDTALDLVAGEIDRVRTKHGNTAIYGGSYGWASAGRFHHAQSQLHRFLNTVGGYVRHTESYSLGAAHVILPYVVGHIKELMTRHTTWDVLASNCEMLVTFGGVPVKNAQVAPGGVAKHRVRGGLLAMQEAGTRIVNVAPVNDNFDDGIGSEWIPLRPGSDTALMLALAWVLRDEGLHDPAFLETHCTGYEKFEAYLLGQTDGRPKTPEWAEQISTVPAGTIRDLARDMARSRTMLNIAWSLQRAEHGEQPFWMLVTLAAMLGQIGLPGGGFGVGYGPANTMGTPHQKLRGPTLSQLRNPVSDYIPVARIADMLLNPGAPFTHDGKHLTYPDIRLVYWAGGNPYHHHQDLNRLNRAWARPETIIVQEPFWTATAKRADIVLPVSTSLERNDIGYSNQEGYLIAMRKAAPDHADARSDFAILSGLARRMGVEPLFTEGRDEMGWLRHLWEECANRWAKDGITLPDFETFWDQGLCEIPLQERSMSFLSEYREDPHGHPVDTPTGRIELYSKTLEGFALRDVAPYPCWTEPQEWLGSPRAKAYPLHLLSDQPRYKLHSQLDVAPLSTRHKIDGREPLYMSSADALERGLEHGDTVEVYNDRGACLAGLVVSEKITKGVVRMSTGSWYDPDETGRDRYGNPNVLTRDIGASGLSQGCAAQSCLVECRPWTCSEAS